MKLLTDIILESVEVVCRTPLLSEDESVWELTVGFAKDETRETNIPPMEESFEEESV